MKKICLCIVSGILFSLTAYAVEFTADLEWYKLTGTEHYNVYYKDTYSKNINNGHLIRMDLLNDKNEIERKDIINSRRQLIWQLYPSTKQGIRYKYTGDPVLTVTDQWKNSKDVQYIRDEECNGMPCKVYLWTDPKAKFFKVAYYYWISKENIIIQQNDDKMGKTFISLTNVKIDDLRNSVFDIPDEYNVNRIE